MTLKNFIRYLGTTGYSRSSMLDIMHELIMYDYVTLSGIKYTLEHGEVNKESQVVELKPVDTDATILTFNK